MGPEDRKHLEESLSAYLDGHLTEADRAALERRLAGDPELRRTLGELESTARLVRSLPVEPSPPGLHEDTLAMLERDLLLGPTGREPTAVAERPRRASRWLATAAVVAMASTAGFFTIQQMRSAGTSSPGGGRELAMGKDQSLRRIEQGNEIAAEPGRLGMRRERGLSSTGEWPPTRDGEPGEGGGRFDSPAEEAVAEKKAADELSGRESGATRLNLPASEDESDRDKVALFMHGDDAAPSPATESIVAGTGAVSISGDAAATPLTRPSQAMDDTGGGAYGYKDESRPVVTRLGVPLPRVEVQIATAEPARMYALAARAKSFAATEKLRVIPPGSSPATRAVESSENAKADRRAVAPREEGARPVTDEQEIVVLARRSQLVRLLNELRIQDPGSIVTVVPEAGAAGGAVPVVDMLGALSADDGRLRQARDKAESSVRQQPETRSAAETESDGSAWTYDKRLSAAVPSAGSDRVAGGRKGASPIAAGPPIPIPPGAADTRASGWVDRVVGLMGQAERTLEPDPMTEVHLIICVEAAEPTTPPRQFEDAPQPGLPTTSPANRKPE